MPDFEEMYYTLFQEIDRAVKILTNAQKKCMEMHKNSPPMELIVLPTQQEEDD